MRRRPDPRREVDVVSDVALLGDEWGAGVQADPHLDPARGQPVRHRPRRGQRRRRRTKREEERISLIVDLDPALGHARTTHDPPVLGKDVRIRLHTQLVQERRRPFNVAEEQGDRAGREIPSHSAIIRRARLRVQSTLDPGYNGSPPGPACFYECQADIGGFRGAGRGCGRDSA